jgi:hypothetical protein
MDFFKKHWVTIAAILGGIEAIYASIDSLLAKGEAPSAHQIAVTAGVALFAYLLKRPGDLTKAQADEHAEKAVRKAVLPNIEDLDSVPQLPAADVQELDQ